MIKWPSRAGAALRKLFEPLQEIDVYIEDTNDEAFYRCLLNSATNGEIKVARVFALGGRQAVIAAAAAHNPSGRRSLYIIDGDIPWIRGDSFTPLSSLYCHDAYCVENIIICEKALSIICSQEIAVLEDDAENMLSYQKWIDCIKVPLLELFSAFATVNEFNASIPTVSQGVGVLCSQTTSKKHTNLDLAKTKLARDKAIKDAENVVDPQIVSKRYESILKRISALPDPLYAVSGKDFLLPLIDFHLQSFGCRIKRKSLRIRLASAGDRTRFAPLANALVNAAKGIS